MKKLAVLFFYFLALVNFAQTTSLFQVIDSQTGSAVPFALVIDQTNKKGTITDENGSFLLMTSDSSHLFSATSIGYDTVTFRILYSAKQKPIYLTQLPVKLDPITVFPSRFECVKSAGHPKTKKASSAFCFSAGAEIALLISNDSQYSGIIKKIKFYIAEGAYPKTKFRAKLYSVDKANGGPGYLLQNSDIILQASKGGKWVEFDLSVMKIRIPDSGFFVSMEWLPDSRNYSVGSGNGSFQANGQSLGGNTVLPDWITWGRTLDTSWKKYNTVNASKKTNAMIAADVLIECKLRSQ